MLKSLKKIALAFFAILLVMKILTEVFNPSAEVFLGSIFTFILGITILGAFWGGKFVAENNYNRISLTFAFLEVASSIFLLTIFGVLDLIYFAGKEFGFPALPMYCFTMLFAIFFGVLYGQPPEKLLKKWEDIQSATNQKNPTWLGIIGYFLLMFGFSVGGIFMFMDGDNRMLSLFITVFFGYGGVFYITFLVRIKSVLRSNEEYDHHQNRITLNKE